MAFPGNYHADSDADDEYERSILTSPMPPTDDENSSAGDSDGSHDHTPTTFDGPDYDRGSPRKTITEWTTEECANFLDNEIVGEALIALKHDELKEMGVVSVGHRLTILKGVYDIKIKQDVPIDSDHYVPLSAEDGTRNKQATQDDIARIIQSLQIRDQRILEAEAELRKVHDDYKKLREELLPLFKMSKERNESLPSPVLPQNNGANSNVTRKPSKNKHQLSIGPTALKSSTSPTYPSNTTPSDHAASISNAPAMATTYLAQSIQGIDIGNRTSPNIPSPGVSPGTFQSQQQQQQQAQQQSRYASSYGGSTAYSTDSYQSTATLTNDRPPTASNYAPSVRTTRTAAPSIRESPVDNGPSAPSVEVFKSFRVSLDDPCHKVLPAALKRYNIQADWKQYALYIVFGDQERCLGMEEKPLILFKQLDKEGKKPMFMLRRHVTPQEGHTQRVGNGQPLGDVFMGNQNQSRTQLPGGML